MTPADSRRIRLVSDAVVASYIHDISARTGFPANPAPERRHGARAARLAHTRRALRRREDLTHARRDNKRFDRTAASRGSSDKFVAGCGLWTPATHPATEVRAP
jgi:hypothetical protein